MTDEKLIENAADAIRWAAEGTGWKGMARAALAVFEQARAEQGTEEPEWEYGNEQLMHSHVEVFPASSEAVAKAQAWLHPMRRRRKAGPWEAVPAAEGTGQPANRTATGSPSGGPEPLEGT